MPFTKEAVRATQASWDTCNCCVESAPLSVTREFRLTELRSCVKVEVAVLGSQSLTVLMVFAEVKQHLKKERLSSELRSCVKVEVFDRPRLSRP